MGKSNDLGAWGEEKAVRFLRQQGYRILERNFRCPYGEIDVIAQDGDEIVFVEVRLRKDVRYGAPEETVDLRKQRKIKMAVDIYLQQNPTELQPRGDVLALYAHHGMDTRPLPIKHIKYAF